MKRKAIFLLITIFLFFANIAKSQDKDDVTFWFGMSWNPVSISKLPIYLSELPYYRGGGGIINEARQYMSFSIPIELRFLVSNNNLGINYGIGAEMIISNGNVFTENRYNYGGTSPFGGILMLGPSSSLGLRLIEPGFSLQPNFFIEIPISRKDVKKSCNLYASVGYEAVSYVNGWDTRYSDGNRKLKYNTVKVLAHIIPLDIGLQSNVLGIKLEAGPSILLPIKTRAGRDCNVQTNAIGFYIKMQVPEN